MSGLAGRVRRFALVLLVACSSTPDSNRSETPTAGSSVHSDPAPEPAEFVTVAEIWAPDESAVLGVIVAMREAPRGDASDYVLPDAEGDPGDGHGVLFGAQLIREEGRVLSATTPQSSRSFELSRQALSRAVDVWCFDDAELTHVVRVEPCDSCEPWSSPETAYVLVVPEGQSLSSRPEVGWTIAISP